MSFDVKFLISQPAIIPPVVATSTPPPTKARTSTGMTSSIDLSGFLKEYSTPEGMLTIGSLIFVILFLLFLGGGNGKITTGKVCGTSERLAATSMALKQIRNRKHNQVCLWCVVPVTGGEVKS